MKITVFVKNGMNPYFRNTFGGGADKGGFYGEFRTFTEAHEAAATDMVTRVVLQAETVHNTWAPTTHQEKNVTSTGATLTIEGGTVAEVEKLFQDAIGAIRQNVNGHTY